MSTNTKDNLFTGDEARAKLMVGVSKIAHAVGGTMGTAGYNAIIETIESPGHLITNDGYTIASSIKLADPIEQMGRNILLEAISKANKQSGDGSSTTTVLCNAILEEGVAQLKEASPIEIKRSLEDCIPIIEASLKDQCKEIGLDEVHDVASVASEDQEVGVLIQEIYSQIGREGIIYWDISKTATDSYVIGKGITVNGTSLISPYMADLDEKTGQLLNVARLKQPRVLIAKQKITSAADFNDLFQTLFNEDVKEILVFCDEYEANVIADLIKTRAVRGFKAILVKMPVIWKDLWYEDLAKASGATIIDPNSGISFKTIKKEHLGTFGSVTITKEDTYIDGIKDLSEHLHHLDDGSDEAKNRIARLNTSTARLFIGAHSESALSYKRLKVEDAINAAWQALHGGVVAGGGVALLNASYKLPANTIGGRILKSALQSPMRQIISNAGHSIENWKDMEQPFLGFDALIPEAHKGFNTLTGKMGEDMFEAGIVDPMNVVLNACKNAISVAATVLTAEAIITYPRDV